MTLLLACLLWLLLGLVVGVFVGRFIEAGEGERERTMTPEEVRAWADEDGAFERMYQEREEIRQIQESQAVAYLESRGYGPVTIDTVLIEMGYSLDYPMTPAGLAEAVDEALGH